jgi:hypothetical protein
MKLTAEQKEFLELFKKDNPLPFSKYKKLVESTKYKDFTISLSDIAKYPGELTPEYKYRISCPNWEGSGYPGTTLIVPSFPPFKVSHLGSKYFDRRVQLSKEDLQEWIQKVANTTRYNNPKYAN